MKPSAPTKTLAANYDCATDYTWTHPTPTDNCAVTAYTISYLNPDGSTEGPTDVLGQEGNTITRNFELGTSTMTYVVEDAEGNVTECSFTVEVIDDEIPMIFCEENLATNVFTFLGSLETYPEDTTSAVITVAPSMTITDVNIPALAGLQPDNSDLKVTLTSPAGTTITLFDGLCPGTADFNLALDDDAATSIANTTCNPLGNGNTFVPQELLAAFNGENSAGNWVLTFENASPEVCGELLAWDIEIIGNNVTPTGNRLQVTADAGRCTYTMTGTDFDPRFTDNCEGAFITHNYLGGPFDTTLMGSTFPLGETVIRWLVTDAAGNVDSCNIIVEVLDDEKPVFTTCERPDIIANPTPGVCDAFVNFSLPIAIDNCTPVPIITQIDGTGLSTGQRFPVGTTILFFEATDAAGNRDTCSFRVIVNDNQGVVATSADGCPEDVFTVTDPGDCVAVVTEIAPMFADNCGNNLAFAYRIDDINGNLITSGFDDASGTAFQLGENTVTYRAQDQPFLLITEVTHDIQNPLGGNDAIPSFITPRALPNGDLLEVTNFGPAALDIGGLDIERIRATGIDAFRIPALTVLQPGDVLTIHFSHDDDSPENFYFNVHCATDLTPTDAAAYVISHSGRVLDAVSLNGFNPVGQGNAATVSATDFTGSIFDVAAGIRRASVYDTDDATDFISAYVCGELTIGSFNPDLDTYPANNAQTSNQARVPNKLECNFKVAVSDEEAAVCGSYQPYETFVYNVATTIAAGDCFEATIDVTSNYALADVNTLIQGATGDFSNLTIKLISPEGAEVMLANNVCNTSDGFDLNFDSDSIQLLSILASCDDLNAGNILRPEEDLNLFNTRNSSGQWTLQIAHDATVNTEDVTFTNWELHLSELIDYTQQDSIIENDFRECGAEFTWLNPGVFDNCPGGTMFVTFTFGDTIQDTYPIVRNRFGRDTTRFFDVRCNHRYLYPDGCQRKRIQLFV